MQGGQKAVGYAGEAQAANDAQDAAIAVPVCLAQRRLLEKVGYFAERLGTADAIFRDSTIRNIEELIELVPGLNVLDDPNIESIRQQINPKLKIGGVFLTMANDTNFRKDIVAGVKENFGKHLPVLDAVIPATVRLAEISTADKSIFRHEPRGRAAAAYVALVKEVERIGEKQRIRDADITR